MMINSPSPKKFKSLYADERQSQLYKKFPADTFLGNERHVDNFLHWMTFFRRNFHRCAKDYLGLTLHKFQSFLLYLMGKYYFFVIIASRADGKSFIVAIAACLYCILYPGSMVVVASGTKKQAKLLVSEKIEKELMNWSPALRKEILRVKDNQNEVIVYFKNHSTITVVAPGDSGRGYRSTVLIREEFRLIKKEDEDSILSPYQIIRQAPYKADPYYSKIPELKEESVDIYISSSWFDNGQHWLWNVVDQAFDDMMKGKSACLLAFDESVALMHEIKSMRYFQIQKKKQDEMTYNLEMMNFRVKENTSSYFTYSMLEQNQNIKYPFYPRTSADFRAGKKNPYDIPKQTGEVRLVACDMAFVEGKKNDNSVFSCFRLLPESITYKHNDSEKIEVVSGYRRKIPYITSIQGGDSLKQAIAIRRLYEDFKADYLVLDTRNGGLIIYDILARTMYDEERKVEYAPLLCMNDDSIASRIKVEGAIPCIFCINANQNLNSNIAIDFRRVLVENKIDFLITYEKASETVLPDISEYISAQDADTQIFYERPFLETQELISETINLVYEKKALTGAIVISEQGTNRKDRYTSVSYGSYFASLLEKDLVSQNEDYEYGIFIN